MAEFDSGSKLSITDEMVCISVGKVYKSWDYLYMFTEV